MKHLLHLGLLAVVTALPAETLRETASIAAAEAVQAAAADAQFAYAIDSTRIAKYDRATGEQVAVSRGMAQHLNSGFLFARKLYCAHSNYPKQPEHSEIKVLDPESMELTTFKDFGESNGSLTWAVREGDSWWCTFAFYGMDNARTRLVKFDRNWKELEEWTYPFEVVKELGRYSISGGLWLDGHLLVTGHDRRIVYRLRLPKEGRVLELVNTVASPFPGQGIALDAKDSGLVGIDRGKKRVIFARFEK